MNDEEKKQYLNRVREFSRRIAKKEQELLEVALSIDCMGGGNDGERVQSTPEFDKIGSLLADMEELEMQIKIMKALRLKFRLAIMKKVQSCIFTDERYRKVLLMYYIDEMRLCEIANRMGIGENNVKKLKAQAIREYK